MPSFDIVSEVNQHELSNAVDQANREISNRYDFKGSDAHIELQEGQLVLNAQSEFQIQQMTDILHSKMAKRHVDIGNLDPGKVEESGKKAKQIVKIVQGIDSELARKIVKNIKDAKMKVQAAIQGDQVRVTGKKRDDLQTAIALIKEQAYTLPLQFINFRD